MITDQKNDYGLEKTCNKWENTDSPFLRSDKKTFNYF